ncbi:murein L,D-transpeptidase [Pseudovibrio axinellae]|uniref:Murein L,D-transpeptidase n=1 Tax=Pseudovibrio axinellae TaxID=989403 RepID=A0A166AA52_9HYPH|nr:L,D-transpeptidase family protein [Pseudovibrio axinellae]KZL20778.1 murein L,D-transpeptidase [Pseudovibrio axinellae]SER22883.1 Murein L,D-transpeptidase YcbB/YkuD [Pseudovibrio axinellae]
MFGRTSTSALLAGAVIALSSTVYSAKAAIPDNFDVQLDHVNLALSNPVAQQIQQAFSKNHSRQNFHAKREAAAAKLFYQNRSFQPAWILQGKLTASALSVIKTLQAADEEGLRSADYPVPQVGFNADGKSTPEQIAMAELELSHSLLKYAEDAQAGRVSPYAISEDITLRPERPDPIEALTSIARSATPSQVLAAFNPPHAEYKALKVQLAQLREQTQKGELEKQVVIPAGKVLKVGTKSSRVILLRERLSVPTVESQMNVYTQDLAYAVEAFQAGNGLHPDGAVGPRTLLALNGRVSGNPVKDIIANMERWRWMPRDLGQTHLRVNIPEFMVRLNMDGFSLFESRVVVGKRSNKTPVFSDRMKHVIVNPYWNVPYSIASKEILPEMLASNPQSYLRKGNYEIVYGGKIVDPRRVNWNAVTFKKIRIRQRPGRGNALGKIKFMFPNKHNVYLHDTPSKSLFNRSERAFSHGCVRVQNPFDFADALMATQNTITGNYIRSLVGKKQTQVNLQQQIPVHISYFTAFVDEAGKLQRRPDIYGHNQATIDALNL